ncbi:MAG: SHOCT domain-containing protein [Proteobacteria bacterium]|nr:SHOCT domain-containing protein [Pseudomonadota bacterium]
MKMNVLPLLVTGGVFGLVPAASADASSGYGGNFGDHAMMWGGWFMGPMMMLIMIVLVVVAIVVVLKFLGFGGDAQSKSQPQDRALSILNERFAKGEIDKAEFEERKKTLGV